MEVGDLPLSVPDLLFWMDGIDVAYLLWMKEWNPVLVSPSAKLVLFAEDYHGNISIDREFFHAYLRLGWA